MPLAAILSQSEISVGGSFHFWELLSLLAVGGAIVVAIASPFLRALADRWRRPAIATSGDTTARLAEMAHALDLQHRRIEELEERLAFAERLLPSPPPAPRERDDRPTPTRVVPPAGSSG